MDLTEQLQKLQTLREQGALTEEEFTLAKRRLLETGLSSPAGEPAPQAVTSKLHQWRRSLRDKWLGGVCGGLAEMTDMPSWIWRIIFVLAVLVHGLGAVVYILLWIFVPIELRAAQTVAPENR